MAACPSMWCKGCNPGDTNTMKTQEGDLYSHDRQCHIAKSSQKELQTPGPKVESWKDQISTT